MEGIAMEATSARDPSAPYKQGQACDPHAGKNLVCAIVKNGDSNKAVLLANKVRKQLLAMRPV